MTTLRLGCAAAALLAGAVVPGPAKAQAPVAAYAERFAAVCAACHGAQGISMQPLTPSLAGQPSFYAITQLFLFRDGRRGNPLMTTVAKGMSDDDLRGFSDLIGALPPGLTAPAGAADPQRMTRGAALAQRLHCIACHGSELAGGKQVPRLAGQREDYLLQALQGFRAGTRVGYSQAMTEALAGTGADALQDLAHFLAHYAAESGAASDPVAPDKPARPMP